MKNRDTKGRFSKKTEDEQNYLALPIPSLKAILFWIFSFIIFFPWIIAVSKFKLFEKIELIYENLIIGHNEDNSENGKKSGLFY